MTRSLRLAVMSLVVALPLGACGDDGGTSDTDTTGPTTNAPTTDEQTSTGTTDQTSSTTVDPTSSTTVEPTSSTTVEPETTTVEPETTTVEPETSTGPGETTVVEGTSTTTGDGLSLAADVFPEAFAGNCGCHGNGAGMLQFGDAAGFLAATVDVDAAQSAGNKLVAPGDAAASYVVAKLRNTHLDAPFNGAGGQMPKGAAPLDEAKIALVEQWINEGAAP